MAARLVMLSSVPLSTLAILHPGMSGLGGRSDDMNINEKHNYNFVNKGYPDYRHMGDYCLFIHPICENCPYKPTKFKEKNVYFFSVAVFSKKRLANFLNQVHFLV